MNFPGNLRKLACAAALTLLASGAAFADDTEIFLGVAHARELRPNILFIVDTSGSMDSQIVLPQAPYDPAQRYDGDCAHDKVYYSLILGPDGSAQIPTCDNNNVQFVPESSNDCAASQNALASVAGFYTGRVLQWNRDRAAWSALAPGDSDDPLECEADAGVHGENAISPKRFASNGDDNQRWSADSNAQIDWSSADLITVYGANWLNWHFAPPQPANLSRLDTVKSVAAAIAHSVDDVNLGLMRFSNAVSPTDPTDDAEGGMVTHEISNIATARDSIIERVNSYTADGATPLSETLYEAGQYYAGRAVDYGLASRIDANTPFPSVAASRRDDNQALYKSPIEFQCQRNYNILLTDGEPSQDHSADSKIESLPGFNALVGASCDGNGDGHCLDDMAQYLHDADLSPLAGKQSVSTYTIGFGPEVAGSAFLEAVARRGGGRAYSASNVNDLSAALQSIIGEIQRSGATFASPTVSVNAFNRTQTTNELYVSVFRPTTTARWPGNLKKYALLDGAIVDAGNQSAVDPATGFFRDGIQSIWSAAPDGADVESGGAVSRMPAPNARRVFTWFSAAGNRNLTAAQNAFDTTNALLSDAVLRTDPDGAVTRENVINWVLGQDLTDQNHNGNINEVLRHMGDPLHARPAVVNYGGDVGHADARDSVVYVPTNDGFLHAFDSKTGRELWSFIPQSLLGRLVDLYANHGVVSRSYGLDGDVRVLQFDVNQDGIIDRAAGDRVWIYFGMRRGGREYFALDVTDRNNPQLKFVIGPGDLPGIGETWSTPAVARVNVAGAVQNGEKLVLIFGGGYDDAEENNAYVEDDSGHRIYMVDASSGNLLWYAGGPRGAGAPDLALDRMRNAIPGRVVVLDTNADGYADRMYAADLGGRVWRFDITNGNNRNNLVQGGVLAKLGAGDNADHGIANNRRFYSAPDVALIQRRGANPYYSLAIGSGYRGHPLSAQTHDHFFLLRDKNPFGRMSAADYAGFQPVIDGDLVDITANVGNTRVPPAAPGWKLEMRLNGGWSGEKILNEAITVDGTLLFTSYQPQLAAQINPCQPANGVNRAYALRVDEGQPAFDVNHDHVINASDLFQDLAQSGIAGEVSLAVESTAGREHHEGDLPVDALGRRSLCVVGVEVLQHCVAPSGVVRTFWQRSADGGQ